MSDAEMTGIHLHVVRRSEIKDLCANMHDNDEIAFKLAMIIVSITRVISPRDAQCVFCQKRGISDPAGFLIGFLHDAEGHEHEGSAATTMFCDDCDGDNAHLSEKFGECFKLPLTIKPNRKLHS